MTSAVNMGVRSRDQPNSKTLQLYIMIYVLVNYIFHFVVFCCSVNYTHSVHFTGTGAVLKLNPHFNEILFTIWMNSNIFISDNASEDVIHFVHVSMSLQWHHNERHGVSTHQPHDCLLNRLFRRISKKTSKLCITGLCAGNSPVIGEFPAQRARNMENVSIWWHHHGVKWTMQEVFLMPWGLKWNTKIYCLRNSWQSLVIQNAIHMRKCFWW